MTRSRTTSTSPAGHGPSRSPSEERHVGHGPAHGVKVSQSQVRSSQPCVPPDRSVRCGALRNEASGLSGARAGAGGGDEQEAGGDVAKVARMWNPTARRMKPDENPASPPQKLIARSATPCTATRWAAGTLSTRRLEPPMRPKFQPRPSSHSDGNSSSSTSPDSADSEVAATSSTAPTEMARVRPAPVAVATDERAERVHAGDVQRHDVLAEPFVAVQLEVHRCHRHHRDHRHLRDDHRRDGQPRTGVSADDAHRRAELERWPCRRRPVGDAAGRRRADRVAAGPPCSTPRRRRRRRANNHGPV